MEKRVRADLMLLVVTIFWGASYILTKIGLRELQPFNLTAVRFIIAFCVSAAVFYKHIIKTNIKTIKYSLILAVILFCVFISMSFGLKYTSASNAGFLVSLSVILIPLLSFIFLRQSIEKRILLSACTALLGLALLTLNEQLRISGGDALCVLCAFLFAVHVVATGVFTRNVDSIALGVLQLGFVSLFSLAFSFITEGPRFPHTVLSWSVVLLLSILCTAAGYILQAIAQQYTSASHTGLILALEPVFSALFAFMFLGEVLSVKGYIGAAILIFSVFLAEIQFKKKEEPNSCMK